MSVIVVPADIRAALLAAGGRVEFRDEAGSTLGEFVARVPPPELDISMEEVERLCAPDRKTYTTAEVLAYVRGLT